MKKSLFIIIACALGVISFQAFTPSKEPGFENLKVLPKDISKKDLDSVMHFFTASLGVKCNFCHVRNEAEKKMDFASDDKMEKQIARKMMLMSININRNYFKMEPHHDMDHNHDMNKDMDHDHDMNKDMMDHDMDTSANMEPAKFMLRTVTCYTCHRGSEHPEKKPPMMPEGPMPPPPPPPPPPAPPSLPNNNN
jgi:hypothetical protein